MLVLSRKRSEIIRIGDDIQVVIAEIRGDKVYVGIVAPKEVPVNRQEIYDAIQRGEQRPPRMAIDGPRYYEDHEVCGYCGRQPGQRHSGACRQ